MFKRTTKTSGNKKNNTKQTRTYNTNTNTHTISNSKGNRNLRITQSVDSKGRQKVQQVRRLPGGWIERKTLVSSSGKVVQPKKRKSYKRMNKWEKFKTDLTYFFIFLFFIYAIFVSGGN